MLFHLNFHNGCKRHIDCGIREGWKATGFYAASDLVSIYFTSKDQLKSVTRMGDKVASAILSVTESGGNISEQVLCVTKGFYT